MARQVLLQLLLLGASRCDALVISPPGALKFLRLGGKTASEECGELPDLNTCTEPDMPDWSDPGVGNFAEQVETRLNQAEAWLDELQAEKTSEEEKKANCHLAKSQEACEEAVDDRLSMIDTCITTAEIAICQYKDLQRTVTKAEAEGEVTVGR
eukprot:gb/GFBE01070445.1/.p1 GENE.gb/GFBE01070445.1/~~gb/GFBE01070445.1/.p1  ORF type:complete len:154 (+),score=57.04 gb/GFBE01070445.1/:1-462(+)